MAQIYQNLTPDEIMQLEFQAGKKAAEMIDKIISEKLNIQLSAEDNGKILQVGADGKVVPMTSSEGLTIDDTLSVSDAAADAKAVGDTIAVAEAALAPTFSTSTAYTAGQYVWYDGTLYRFTTDHAAGSWNAAQVELADVANDLAGDVSDLKSAINVLEDDVYDLNPVATANSIDVTSYQENTFPKATSSINEGSAVSSVKLYCCGKNHLKLRNTSGGSSGFTWTSNTDGSVTLNGTADKKYYLYFGAGDNPIGEVLFVYYSRWRASITKSAQNDAVQIGFNGDGQGDYYNWSDTTSKYSNSVGILIPSGTVCDNLTVYPMLEYGDYRQETTFTYEAFSGFVKEHTFDPSVTTGTVDWGELEIPENATTLWHYTSTNTVTIFVKASVIENIENELSGVNDDIGHIETEIANMPENIRYDLSSVSADQSWNGMKLDGTGGWAWLSGYKVERYVISDFDKLYLELNQAPNANYEFHTDATLAASTLVGQTYNTKVKGLVNIPDTATNVFICYASTDTEKQIKRATNWVDGINDKLEILFESGGLCSAFEKADSKTASMLTICENFHLKKGFTISFYGAFDTYSYIEIGQGINTSQGRSIKITATTIESYFVGTNKVKKHEENHGLTFADYIYVKIDVTEESNVNVTIMTNGTSVTKSMGALEGGSGNCEAYISGTMTSVKGTIMATDALEDVFIFGDSYINPFSSSYTKQLVQNGYTKYLLSGVPGATGANEIGAFATAISLRSPKVALWALGMNDSSLSDYKTYAEQFVNMCISKNITPVLATIPNVSGKKDKTSINSYVKESGYRYVDFAKAVGAESSDSTWYTGMLIDNDIHPTDLGGVALMNMLFVDLPEILGKQDAT